MISHAPPVFIWRKGGRQVRDHFRILIERRPPHIRLIGAELNAVRRRFEERSNAKV
jgi:hypothetical protein